MRISDWSSDVCSSDLATKALGAAIVPANYEVGLQKLKDCDLIIEAIAERMDWKQDLYEKIAPFVADHAVLASNTSGLGINKRSEEHTSELPSLMRISYAVFCLKKKTSHNMPTTSLKERTILISR